MKRALATTATAVVLFLDKIGPCGATVSEISEGTKRSKHSVRSAITSLSEKGLVKLIGSSTVTRASRPRGVWALSYRTNAPGHPRNAGRNATSARVRRYLSEHAEATSDDIADELGVKRHTIQWMLRCLERRGLIEKTGRCVKLHDGGGRGSVLWRAA